MGYLWGGFTVGPYTGEDVSCLADVAKILSIEMQKDDFYNHRVGMTYEYFMRDLVEQNITSREFALHRMEQLGRPPCAHYWIMILSFTDETVSRLNSQYYIDQLTGIFRGSICFKYKGNLVVLLNSHDTDPFYRWDRHKFEHFLQLNRLYAAVSYRY